MDYQIINDSETEKEIEVRLSSQELIPYIDNSINKIRESILIKGYRKGRAPKDLIRKKYYDRLKAEAINDLIIDLYKKVAQEKNWETVANPELVSYDDKGEIKIRLRIEIIPEFNVDNYLGLELFKEESLPMEYLYEQTIERLREDYSTVSESTKPAAVDDFITLDLEIVEGNRIIDKQSEVVIKLGDRSFPDELNRALVGVKKGITKEIPVKNQIYRVKIIKVEEKILPQVNEEFARMLKFKDLEEMKKGITEMLQKQEEERLNEGLQENLARVLLERFRFAVPKSLLEREYQFILSSYNLRDNDSNRERFLPLAENRARYNIILDKIALKENIKPLDDDVNKLAQRNSLRLDDINEEVRDYLEKIVVRNEVVEFLLKNANITQRGRILSPEEARNANSSIRH